MKSFELDKETRLALNRKAREELKLKLLVDIRVDIEVCKIEGWDYLEYLHELKELIGGFENGNRNKGRKTKALENIVFDTNNPMM